MVYPNIDYDVSVYITDLQCWKASWAIESIWYYYDENELLTTI